MTCTPTNGNLGGVGIGPGIRQPIRKVGAKMLLMSRTISERKFTRQAGKTEICFTERSMFCVAGGANEGSCGFQDNLAKFILKPISGIGVAPLISALTVLLVAPSPVTFQYQQKT
ncbi:hypothetical protein FHT79_002371 [Rhizobium sp. BK212]|nr:hypothetical protein [Rhizobium sp. BK212]